MKTFLIAVAAVATLGAALPAAAQTRDRGDRQFLTHRVEQRFDRDGRSSAWRSWQAREMERRLEERRRIEWRMHHRHDFRFGYDHRDNAYGYRR